MILRKVQTRDMHWRDQDRPSFYTTTGQCSNVITNELTNQLTNKNNQSHYLLAEVIITSAEEGGYVFTSVCLSVCLSLRRITEKSCEWILTKFLGGVGHGPETKGVNFGDDPDHRPDPGVRSPKSGFTWLSKKLPTDFDEILWRAGVWPRDQLITFWWRSASLSGSGSPFRITIRIREELPRWILTKFLGGVGHGPETKWLNFNDD